MKTYHIISIIAVIGVIALLKLSICVFCNKDEKFGECLLKHRKKALLWAFLLSILVALAIIGIGIIIKKFNCICDYEEEYLIIYRGFLYTLSPLPLFFLLWFFRHTDTQENLAKQQQNIHQNALFNAQALILKSNNAEKSLAIAQLKTLLRTVPEFRESIHIALKAGLQPHAEWTKPVKLEADFSNCDLHEIDLQNTQLVDANLQGTNLQDANLQGANLQGVDLQETNLQGANLQEADLSETDLQGVDLQGANLQEADLSDTNLQETNLQGAVLQGAFLARTHLQGKNLQGTNLQMVRFHAANLQGANLQEADLRGVDLQGANLQEIKWKTNHELLKAEQYLLPIYNDNTKFSDDISDYYKNGVVGDKNAFKKDMLTKYRLLHIDELTGEMWQKRKEYRKQMGLTEIK